MKKLTFLFALFSVFIFSQENLSEEQLNKKLDSLNIDYKTQIKDYIKAKNNVSDLYNILIYNGDYNKDVIEKFNKELNSVQKYVVFSAVVNSESKALEFRDKYSEIIDLKIKAEKYKLLALELFRLGNIENEKNDERVLTFLRESKFSPSSFKKLSNEERLKLVENFEMNKDGVTPDIINYYKSMNDDEKKLFDLMIKYTTRQSISEDDIKKKYFRLLNDKVIYRNYDWSDDYFPTLKIGEKILNYIKFWLPKGY